MVEGVYRCNACQKTLMDTTNTIFYRTRKSNEWIIFLSTKHTVKEFLVTSFIYEMTETYQSIRLSTINV